MLKTLYCPVNLAEAVLDLAPSRAGLDKAQRMGPCVQVCGLEKGSKRTIGVGFLSGIFSPDRDDF
jgi:hypothetical protein